MQNNIFIPEKINVGLQIRQDTYTGKLAYIAYYDNQGILRQEKAQDGWCDKNIPKQIYDNKPISGFVLNKKVGGHKSGWNHRQTYVRVYDPRGFEFELTIPNLLYILENTSSVKGKGLEGEFVYGYSGGDLVLLPTCSPDYEELTSFNDKLRNKEAIKAKNLVLGGTYLTKNNEEFVYMGRYDVWDTRHGEYVFNQATRQKEVLSPDEDVNAGLFFVFAQRTAKRISFLKFKNISGRFVSVVSDVCASDYAILFEAMEIETWYSPIDVSRGSEWVPLSFVEFDALTQGGRNFYIVRGIIPVEPKQGVRCREVLDDGMCDFGAYFWLKSYFNTKQELYDYCRPHTWFKYLRNGKKIKGE